MINAEIKDYLSIKKKEGSNKKKRKRFIKLNENDLETIEQNKNKSIIELTQMIVKEKLKDIKITVSSDEEYEYPCSSSNKKIE